MFSLVKYVDATAKLVTDADIYNSSKLRIVADGTGTVVVRGKLKAQSSYKNIATLSGPFDRAIDIRYFELLEIEVTSYGGSPFKVVAASFEGASSSIDTYDNFASFPPASGSGSFAFDAATFTLYYDDPDTTTWTASSAGTVSLTNTYIAYGSATNELTGESDFTYNATTNTVAVQNILLDSVDLKTVQYHVERFVLDATDISNKFVTLAKAPLVDSKTSIYIVKGTTGSYGTDFTIVGAALSWNTLTLDGLLEIGDEIVVTYL